jgi:oligopeptidase A
MIYSHLLSSFSLGECKARFNAIAEKLAQLSTAFTKNVLDATKAFSLLLTSPEQVGGLPSSALGMFAQAAKAKGLPDASAAAGPWLVTLAKAKGLPDASAAAGPWLVTLDAPSYMPIMQHAKDRSVRLYLPCVCPVSHRRFSILTFDE